MPVEMGGGEGAAQLRQIAPPIQLLPPRRMGHPFWKGRKSVLKSSHLLATANSASKREFQPFRQTSKKQGSRQYRCCSANLSFMKRSATPMSDLLVPHQNDTLLVCESVGAFPRFFNFTHCTFVLLELAGFLNVVPQEK